MFNVVAFDADDTLWHNERLFRFTEAQFAEVLADYVDEKSLERHLLEVEKRNLDFYGFGIKGFMLSMIETAIEVTEGRVETHIISRILEAGRAMINHPVETLPDVRETLSLLHENYKLILITKGDLFDQERKLAQSGLGDFFNAVEVVSDKNMDTYRTLFLRHGKGPQSAMMVGNSLKSDVVPALQAGAYGVHIPYEITWILEEAEEPRGEPRYKKLSSIAQLPLYLETLSH